MDHFQRREDGTLCAEDVPLEEIAARYGTPTYVYSSATITRHVRVLSEAMGDLPHLICYAVKANGNLALLELMKSLDSGFDAVSVGELARVLKIGADPKTVIVSGVGKRDDEIEAALRADALYITVESEDEMDAVERVAKQLGKKAPVSVRVNPDVDAKTHPYIATGLRQNKFGVPLEAALALYKRSLPSEHLDLCGVTCHIGSQITELSPFEDAAQRMADLANQLKESGVPLSHLGIGGGLGIPYGVEDPPSPAAYGEALAKILGPLGYTIVLEPGRVIVGNAGILLSRVTRTKQGSERGFVIIDAAMNDLLRPALYDAKHTIVTVAPPGGVTQPVDVVGPVCESADTFAKDLGLPTLREGDLVALRSAGAYGFVMSCNYNGRPRPAEVLCDGNRATLVRERESLGDLWRGEHTLAGKPYDSTIDSRLAAVQPEQKP